MSRPSYAYKSINAASEIRLLTICPDEPDKLITCTMQASQLSSAVLDPYIALSYAWGRVETSKTITVDGQSLAVSKSVFDALKSFRFLSSTDSSIRCNSRVWIDAVCINQSDPVEKTSQVRMMRDIYSSATCVVAWLGTETEAESRGFSLVQEFVQKLDLESLDVRSDEHTALYANLAELVERHHLPHVNHQAWEDVVSILLKPWFTRVWVIQESSCARELRFLCGTDLYSSKPLFTALSRLGRLPWLQHALRNGGGFSSLPSVTELERVSLAASTLGAIREMMQLGNRSTLSDYLSVSTNHKATDPRDKIFALVPMSTDINEDVIDYNLSLPEVLLLAARYELESDPRNLDVLSYAQTFGHLPGVPSWVPCWSEEGGRFTELSRKYSASVRNLPNCNRPLIEIEDGKVLVTTGLQIDRIIRLHPFQPATESIEFRPPNRASATLTNPAFVDSMLADCLFMVEGLKWRFELQQLICNDLKTYPTGQPLEQIFWRSLIQDDKHDLPHETMMSYIKGEKDMMDVHIPVMLMMLLFPAGDVSGAPMSIDQANQAINSYNDYVVENKRRAFRHESAIKPFDTRWNNGRVFAMTEEGFISWIPRDAKIGDGIYVIDGTRIPLLLRPHDDEAALDIYDSSQNKGDVKHCVLIGDVYLHGCMSGPIEEMLKLIPGGSRPKHRVKIF